MISAIKAPSNNHVNKTPKKDMNVNNGYISKNNR